MSTNRLFSQEIIEFEADSINIVDTKDYNYLREKYKLDSAELCRFQNQISDFEKNDRITPPKNNAVLFAGSSTIALWSYRIDKDMAPLNVINRGFGGSILLENIYFYPRIIKPYKPKIVVLYCENDIVNDEPVTIFEKVRYFENLLHNELPDTKLIIVSFKPSPARKDYLDKMAKVNKQLMSYAQKRPNTEYVDVFQSMIINGKIDESLFTQDKLHMNDKGYDLWTKILKPFIIELLKSENLNDLRIINPNKPSIYQVGNSLYIYVTDKAEYIRMYDVKGNNIHLTKSSEDSLLTTGFIKSGIYLINYLKNKSIKTLVR